MSHSIEFDWKKCIFCQKTLKSVKTTCPANSKRLDIGSGYKSLADTVNGYTEAGQLPSEIHVQFWDEGDGIEATCKRHSACWHSACRSQLLHSTALKRISKSATITDEPSSSADFLDSSNEPSTKWARLTRAVFGTSDKLLGPLCFFCDKPGKDLRQVMTFGLNARVRTCASIVDDSFLLAKFINGDMIATEAKYHPACLLSLYYKASRLQTMLPDVGTDTIPTVFCAESIALAEVIAYMEDVKNKELTPSVFTLSELSKLYDEQLERHGVKVDNKVHSTRLKDRLLDNFTNLTAVTHGREVFLTFNEHLGLALQQMHQSTDADAVHLMHTVKMIRNDIFSNASNFNGTSDSIQSVPQSLLTLICMLLEGPGNFYTGDNQAAMTISQLIIFNSVKRPRRKSGFDVNDGPLPVRHPIKQEMSLPIYLGLKLHSATRKKKLVENFCTLGLSISYDRVRQIENKVANSVCERYRADALVCPPILRTGLFTVAAADNIDHNLSSTTAQSSFHGTAISLMQFPTTDFRGVDRSGCNFLSTASDDASNIILPIYYTDVPPCILPSADPNIPKCVQFNVTKPEHSLDAEYGWLDTVRDCIEGTKESSCLSWASFHAELDTREKRPLPIIALLPLFRHSANTAAMIRHSLTVIQAAV